MAEELETLDLDAAPAAPLAAGAKLTINDLPNDVLVSIWIALEDLLWVRHNVPFVCKAWNELYCSRNACPLHEKLELVFFDEAQR